MRKAAYGLGGVIVLLIAAALILPSVVNWNSYKMEIAAEAKKLTGRTLQIGGDLEFGILPAPYMRATDIRIKNSPDASVPNIVVLKELRVSVRLLPLIVGSVEVGSIKLVEPIIELEKDVDGTGNWYFQQLATEKGDFSPSKKAETAPREAEKSSGQNSPQDFSLDLLRFQNGTIVYRDKLAGSVLRLEKLTADMSATSLKGPFTIKGRVQIMDVNLTFDGKLGEFSENSAVPFVIGLGVPGVNVHIGLDGNLKEIGNTPLISASLQGKGDDLGTLIRPFWDPPPAATLGQPFNISALLKGNADEVVVSGVNIALGSSRLTGDLRAQLKGAPQIEATFRSKSLDIDEWLAAPEISHEPDAIKKTSSSPVNVTEPAASVSSQIARGSSPIDLRAKLNLEVKEVIVQKDTVRDVRMKVSMADGVLNLETLSAILPGRTSVNASGYLKSPTGEIIFNGKSSFQTHNLRSVLEWLKVDVSKVPPDRLRSFMASSDIMGTAGQLQIANIVGQLDATRLSGGVTLALRERPAFGASFSFDQINVDAYLGKRFPEESVVVGTGTGESVSTGSSSSPVFPLPAGPLVALKKFDANLQLRVGALAYQKKTFRDIWLDTTLVNGTLKIRDATVRNFAGTSIKVVGTATGLEDAPRFSGTVFAESRDLTGLFHAADIKSSIPPRKLGQMLLAVETNITPDRIYIDADLRLAKSHSKLTGHIIGLTAKPVFDVKLDSYHPKIDRLAELIFGGRSGAQSGPFIIKANVKGDPNALRVSAKSEFTDGELKISGKVNLKEKAPRIDIRFEINQPDLTRFVRVFYPNYRPVKRRLGNLRLAAEVNGRVDDFKVNNLSGNIGATIFSGRGDYLKKERRPAVDLVLKSSTISLSDFFQAPAHTGVMSRDRSAPTPQSKTLTRGVSSSHSRVDQWSRERIDTSALGMLDAEIYLSADTLIYESYRLDQPKIMATLKNRILDIRKVSGKIFDGSFKMKARLDARKTPLAEAAIEIVNARVQNSFFDSDFFDFEAGNLSHELVMKTSGNSQSELLQRLSGNGSLTLTDGVIRGFDLPSLYRELQESSLKNLMKLIPAAAASIGGSKKTPFSSLNGEIQVEKGVVLIRNALLRSRVGDIEASGIINLPTWNMNMVADIRPRKVREVPKLRLTLTGPPDQPNPRFNIEDLTKDAVASGIGGLLQKFLQGAKSGSNSRSRRQNPKSPKNADPAERLIKKLFNGLGR
ncbi:MAG: hypothetical protein CFH41_01939 [Alphaproteobacteria bacterium MarineAlpha11_Bin1]|nr:MAG: hypothetical protein CFH41_01939 [Alphaproteobacteria bacterium MarineAlpha11_Bin1]